MAIEIVIVPLKNGGSFHSYVKLPEANQTSTALITAEGDKSLASLATPKAPADVVAAR